MRSMAPVGMAVLLLFGGCARSEALPPDSASPRVILDAYLDALHSGDCRVARALATLAFAGQSAAFCGSVRVTGYSVFANPSIVNANYVEFGLSLTTSGGDETLPDGSHIWFCSVIIQPGDVWRVDGCGSGP